MRRAACLLALASACSGTDPRCEYEPQQVGGVLFPDGTDRPVPINAALTLVWDDDLNFCNDWPENVDPVRVSVTEVASGEVVLDPTDFRPNDGGMHRAMLPEWKADTEYAITYENDAWADVPPQIFRTSSQRAETPPPVLLEPEGPYALARRNGDWWGYYVPTNRNTLINTDFLEIREVESGRVHFLTAPLFGELPETAFLFDFPKKYERRPRKVCFQARYVNVAGEAGEPGEVVCPERVVR